MIIPREKQIEFLERELKAQNDSFIEKLETPAITLFEEKEEIFLGKFLTIKNGILILKMSNNRGLPRKGEYLNCLALPSELRNYHNWETVTYGDLINRQEANTELVCVWHGNSDDLKFSLVGFRGVDLDFAKSIEKAQGIILVLGPHIPPFQYIANLQELVKETAESAADEILDYDYSEKDWSPILLKDNIDVASFVRSQLECSDIVMLQGPPGTGKTTMIADLCSNLLKENKSILVTALTNRALMEIACKDSLSEYLDQGKISKTNLSVDEQDELPKLHKAKEFNAIAGKMLLSTYFISSGAALNAFVPYFDVVIMDEASQAILPMFAASKRLGKKNIWIGDIKQLPPVVEINDDIIEKKGYRDIVDGFNLLSTSTTIANYQMTKTYRLTSRAAKYTGIFYGGSLLSKSKNQNIQIINGLEKIINQHGGPTLLLTDLPIGLLAPNEILAFTTMIVDFIYKQNSGAKVAVLSCFRSTAKQLQRSILQYSGVYKDLIVETVARVQGLTTDITVFVIPNTSVYRSLEPRLFNVATSRSLSNTIIIADKNIISQARNKEVKEYLNNLKEDHSIYIPTNCINMLGSGAKSLE